MSISTLSSRPSLPAAVGRLTVVTLLVLTSAMILALLDRPPAAVDDEVVFDGERHSAVPLVVSARRITVRGVITAPRIELRAETQLVVEPGARLVATSAGDGGRIDLAAPRAVLGGTISAEGRHGGTVTIDSDRLLLHGRISADGVARAGAVRITWDDNCQQIQASVISASGPAGGRVEMLGSDGRAYLSGAMLAVGSSGVGGHLDVTGDDLCVMGALLDASGALGGGVLRVGGPAHGVGNELRHARSVLIAGGASVRADALHQGRGGDIVVWSDERTDIQGNLSARGGASRGDGGAIELSSRGECGVSGSTDASAAHGKPGAVLLDPANIIISATTGVFPQFELLDPHPAAGNQFGTVVQPLSTGNVVVTSPNDDAAMTDAGAVYLFNGQTGVLIATLTGSTSNDLIGNVGVTALGNGNYVVGSIYWNNDVMTAAGAATWGNGTTGVSGVVSEANSLVGSAVFDSLCSGGITALSNGNYVVSSTNWNNGAGAVTWGSGTTGVSGEVNATNSLVGAAANDYLGYDDGITDGITALSNGNYVVNSSFWNNGAGAATWGSGTTGVSGAVSAANSLVGATAGDRLSSGGTTALSNGNYVVSSPFWNNGAVADAGAATWGNGTTGVSGVVNATNSLVGSAADDRIGSSGITALSNGNYVVSSPFWNNGAVADAGAATWGSGITGVSGVVSATNSLVGATANNSIGDRATTALSNGNYVVRSSLWDNGAVADVGAATWGNGTTGTSGSVSAANSLVGSTANDSVGAFGVTALSNGNYVVGSPLWNNGAVVDAGAVTWGSGTTGVSGPVSATNSLVGSTANDHIGSYDIRALSNGNYVVRSPSWDNGAVADAGAATWGNGTTGVSGVVSTANSLVGSTTNDSVGSLGVAALSNGNYVVSSPAWNYGAVAYAGAATWGNGTTGASGVVSPANSLIGSTAHDSVASFGVTALSNGNYVVSSATWNTGRSNVGVATWMDGTTGQTVDLSGSISASTSVIGGSANFRLGSMVESSVLNQVFITFIETAGLGGGGRVRVIFTDVDPSRFTFASAQVQTVTVQPSYLTRTLNTGTGVTLQASNDITVDSAILANNPAGTGGALTLQAGRSLLINAGITTDHGNLTLIANDQLANGVVNAQRASGAAVIDMAPAAAIDAGTGVVSVDLRAGTGKTNAASGAITLQALTAQSATIANHGLTANSGISQNGVWTVRGASAFTAVNGLIDLHGSVQITTTGATSGTGTTQVSGTLVADVVGGTLVVTGQVVLSGSSLSLIASSIPAAGTVRTLIQNDGADPVAGTFNAVAEGALIPVNGQVWRLSYAGGDGNDVTLIKGGTPNIAWPAPASISEGTALSATQLNATATVPGTFVYNQPVGTVLNAGAHNLSVVFYPTDASLYSTSTTNVPLTVTAAGTPAITSALTASGQVGVAFVYLLTATNFPTGYAVAGLPTGLTYDPSTRLIVGTPTTAATTPVSLSATNSVGTGNATLSISIAAAASGGAGSTTYVTEKKSSCGLGSGLGALTSALALFVLLTLRRRRG